MLLLLVCGGFKWSYQVWLSLAYFLVYIYTPPINEISITFLTHFSHPSHFNYIFDTWSIIFWQLMTHPMAPLLRRGPERGPLPVKNDWSCVKNVIEMWWMRKMCQKCNWYFIDGGYIYILKKNKFWPFFKFSRIFIEWIQAKLSL